MDTDNTPIQQDAPSPTPEATQETQKPQSSPPKNEVGTQFKLAFKLLAEKVVDVLLGKPFEFISDATEDKVISRKFAQTHASQILVVIILLFVYITNRYACIEMTAKIEKLKVELIDTRYEALTRSSELVGISRPSEVKELIHQQGSELKESDQPAYNLE